MKQGWFRRGGYAVCRRTVSGGPRLGCRPLAAGEPERVCCQSVRRSDSGVRSAAPDDQGTMLGTGFFVRQSEARMNQAFIAKMSIAAVAALMVAGCATKFRSRFSEARWKPVNRFAAATTEIPLYSSYDLPGLADGWPRLKAMLERWAKDSGRTLDYRPELGLHPVRRGSPTSTPLTLSRAVIRSDGGPNAAQGISVSSVGQPDRCAERWLDADRVGTRGAAIQQRHLSPPRNHRTMPAPRACRRGATPIDVSGSTEESMFRQKDPGNSPRRSSSRSPRRSATRSPWPTWHAAASGAHGGSPQARLLMSPFALAGGYYYMAAAEGEGAVPGDGRCLHSGTATVARLSGTFPGRRRSPPTKRSIAAIRRPVRARARNRTTRR